MNEMESKEIDFTMLIQLLLVEVIEVLQYNIRKFFKKTFAK